MAHSNWCGKSCSECNQPCKLDESFPCSLDCKAIDSKTNLHNLSICISCGADLVNVTQEEASEIIETRELLGCFYVKESNGKFTGIDNSKGDAWTEEFDDMVSCFKWLYGVEE